MSSDISTIVQGLLADRTREQLAGELRVSVPTVRRWELAESQPRAEQEGHLRRLAEAPGQLAIATAELPGRAQRVDEELARCLSDIRESLHRRARLGSRSECLDEAAKLLFAHIVDVTHDGGGVTGAVDGHKGAARALREFVASRYRAHLPENLGAELSPDDFDLRLKDSEDELAVDLADAFASLTAPTLRAALADPQHADFLNGVFGSFLADSFADERQLGQYLTPSEVVDFMVGVALELLDPGVVDAWLHPDDAQDVGCALDPSCGVASFLTNLVRQLLGRRPNGEDARFTHRWLERFTADHLSGIDKSERMIRLAVTNFALLGNGIAPLHLANALARTGPDGVITSGLEGRAALILTNPPFGAEFRGSDLAEYNIANGWASRTPLKVDSELLFLERYIGWLRPGGVVLAIVPDSILTNRGLYADLREALQNRVSVETCISLPAVTFAAAGTSTKTSVLGLRKKPASTRTAYVAVCDHVGFDVETRASHRRKVRHAANDLPQVRQEVARMANLDVGRLVPQLTGADRWDAGFHCALPRHAEELLAQRPLGAITVRDVADLVNDRTDPRRSGEPLFRYVEIADVDPELLSVRSKQVPADEAPSRARKLIRAGDVLVSTVRPERRTIGVVGPEDDGAVCSTGFAVLRPRRIAPFALAALLRADLTTTQLLRHTMGVAYPAIDERCILDVLLPADHEAIERVAEASRIYERGLAAALRAREDLDNALAENTPAWAQAAVSGLATEEGQRTPLPDAQPA